MLTRTALIRLQARAVIPSRTQGTSRRIPGRGPADQSRLAAAVCVLHALCEVTYAIRRRISSAYCVCCVFAAARLEFVVGARGAALAGVV